MHTELRFSAMGSDAHVVVVGGAPTLADAARRRIEALEDRWSRFRASSEVSACNRLAGTPVVVSAETAALVARSIDAWRLTEGTFDPTVLGAVIRAGYDRTLDDVRAAPAPGESDLVLGCAGIEVRGNSVRLSAGTGFDPGGIGKGFAADLVVSELMAAGAEGACVGLGGDVCVAGAAAHGDTWTVAVDYPELAHPIALLGLRAGGVATSTTLRRNWELDDHVVHHLIDPRTGRSSDSDVVFATVVAGQAWAAEALAKDLLVRGSLRVLDEAAPGTVGLTVDRDGRITASPALRAYLGATTKRTLSRI